ncbi:M20/M25/M40 family metallo-hydrolase [Streptomyces sp. NBC_00576]|uniref:M20/M25/M40 family metallo-hydrolase n=1 Tax=Streptomyces sp. NBC_00576 TaxID=2903665 RepID=UPI002E7FF47C|nr:M20/M25/M40 family metallo-hydrolase [Streptomyces sp. NBC_00576]WUB72361.1 M20/M25/M40 family metallo-hydrolase [Streptomyces sp. NBC_00576]
MFEVLDALAGVRRGIISNPGEGAAARARAKAALDEAFAGRFTDDGLIHWGPKTARGIFDNAVASAGVPADNCVFVGEDPDERAVAREAGLRGAAHPVFTRAAVEGRRVFWARIELPEGRSLAELEAVASSAEVVPVHVADGGLVLAMTTAQGVDALEQGGFTVRLQDQVEETAAFLVRDDRQVAAPPDLLYASAEERARGAAALRASAAFDFVASELAGTGRSRGLGRDGRDGRTVVSLGPAPGGVYIAAAAGVPVEEVHIEGAKPGHTERLLPDPALLSRPGESDAEGLVQGSGRGLASAAGFAAAPSAATIASVRAAVTPAVIRDHVARISGVDPLVDGEPRRVRSRDAASDENPLVADALAHRLHDLGLAVRLHRFTWRGHRLSNVEAEFPVAGSDGAVLVTAHLDSTADQGEYVDENGHPRPYDPAVDPAPGADDDGSGVAAVMAAAECLSEIVATGREPTRTLRFVLFNAEEQGLVGSKVYARAAAAAGDSIAGVLQMDMIAGFQSDGGGAGNGARPVEIHAGSAVPGPAVGASDTLGDLVEAAVGEVAPDLTTQRLTGADDPAAGRSDHASFHERGWAAVAVCENFFDDTAPATGTQQYHKPGDTLGDQDHNTDYAASIARGVTTAALTLAGL